MKINKNHMVIRITAEQAYEWKSMRDALYERKLAEVIETLPTAADWDDYRKAKEAHDYLLKSPYFEDGGPDERSSINPPEPLREYVYAETVEEWIARCLEIDKEDAHVAE